MTSNHPSLSRFFFLLLFHLIICQTASSQIIGLDLLDRNGKAEVPFSLEQGFIIVEVWLNGIIPLKMIFDTGAENTILFDKEIAQILGIEFERQIPIIGSDLDSVLIANISRNVVTRLVGCNTVMRDIIVLQDNTLLLKEKLGTEINGIIGGSYFANLVMEINYKKNKIYFTHPNQFKPPSKNYHKFKLNVVSNKPYVKGSISISGEQKKMVNLLVDTGASLPFLIHTNTDSTLVLPERVMVGNVGFGLSGAIYGYRGKSNLFELGDLRFNQIVTSFQDLLFDEIADNFELIRNGIIGNTLLSRFNMIIDYTNEYLYLKPGKKYNEDFSFDKSGITIFAVGPQLNQYYVVAVIKDSPADLAGVRPGDLITKVGRKKAKRFTLSRITDKFTKKEGKKIKLTLKRGTQEFAITFQLKEWFNVTENIRAQ